MVEATMPGHVARLSDLPDSAAEVSYDGAASGLAAGNVQEATDAIWAKIRECLMWEGVD
jgi:hypothetical protein